MDTYEVECLRIIYEAARKLLRYNGIDKDKVNEALSELDEGIELVKYYDGGCYEFDQESEGLGED